MKSFALSFLINIGYNLADHGVFLGNFDGRWLSVEELDAKDLIALLVGVLMLNDGDRNDHSGNVMLEYKCIFNRKEIDIWLGLLTLSSKRDCLVLDADLAVRALNSIHDNLALVLVGGVANSLLLLKY